MSFERLQLHPILARNLGLMGYAAPRPIQEQAAAPILAGRDLIGLAQTGTGKTAAFAAPVAHHLISHKPPVKKGRPIEPMTRLRALVLGPTRELAQQVAKEAAAIAQGSVLRIGCVYGKSAVSPQAQMIARGVDMLVGTPGRVRELLESGALSLAYVRHVVIDEADRMLDMGFLPQVTAIMEAIPATGQRQVLLFTATMPPPIEELTGRFLRDPVRIEAGGRHTTPVEHVRQHLVPVHDRDKVALLLHLLEHVERKGVLVFCNTRRRVGWVGTALERNGIKVGMLHGDRSQAQRQRTLARFSNDELHALVATDVAARGLHVASVRMVVNYDLPLAPEEYVHRIGRAAHGDPRKRGHAFTFLAEDDRLRWRAILDATGIEVFAEEVEGFEPSVEVRKPARRADDGAAEPTPRKQKIKTKRKGRSPKSRPIKKGQRPGSGVKRIS